MKNHTSIIALHLPEHRIEYTGLSLAQANKAADRARLLGCRVTIEGAPVTGSNRLIWHYTVVSTER